MLCRCTVRALIKEGIVLYGVDTVRMAGSREPGVVGRFLG
jgi:hypothetical protein